MGMLDALLGRKFKTSKFKATVNLAISRISVLNNQHKARLAIARSDVVQLLYLNQHENALLRVDQVIKGQNMLDVLVMIEGYCRLLIERVSLIEKEKACPEELEEAASSLLFAAARFGEFPELQEIRAVLTARFGKEFASCAIELWNNSKVNHKVIQKLSARQATLESRMKVLKEMASENGIVLQIDGTSESGIVLQIDGPSSVNKEEKLDSRGTKLEDGVAILPEEMEEILSFSESTKGRKKKYRDVADAAQAAFESAAYAAAAARAAVELSRSQSFDPDDQDSPNSRSRKVHNFHEPVKSKLQNYDSEFEDEAIHVKNTGEGSKSKNSAEFKRSVSGSSSDSKGDTEKWTTRQNKPFGNEIVFDNSDDETGNEQAIENPKSYFSEGLRVQGVHLNLEKRTISMRTKRGYGL